MTDSFDRLFASIQAASQADPECSRTSRLMQAGIIKIAKKLAEEAVEVGLEAVHGDREAIVHESADLMYNLCVLLAVSGISLDEVRGEIARREELFGIAEKLPKKLARLHRPRLVPAVIL